MVVGWGDGVCEKMLMDKSINHLFRLASKWKPQGVGIEVTGQQKGFLAWIKQLMQDRNIYFTLSSEIGSNQEGIRPTKDKMSRFQTNALPLLKMHKINFPEELRDSDELEEMLGELFLATQKGFKSKHDDQIDNVTMLGEIETWRPSEEAPPPAEDIQEHNGRGRNPFHSGGSSDGGGSSYFV